MWMILIAHGDWMANNSFLKKILRRKKFYSCFFWRGENICTWQKIVNWCAKLGVWEHAVNMTFLHFCQFFLSYLTIFQSGARAYAATEACKSIKYGKNLMRKALANMVFRF